jgi:hypothetical protein
MELGIEIVFSYITGNNLQNCQSAAAIQSRHLLLLGPTEYRQQGYRSDKCSIARFCFEEHRLRSFRGFLPKLQILHAGSPSVGLTSAAIPLRLNAIGLSVMASLRQLSAGVQPIGLPRWESGEFTF